MLKKDITYTYKHDETEEEITETKTHWFNLNEIELVRMEAEFEEDGGLSGRLQAISDGKKSNKEIVQFFEDIVSSSYGIKDGPDFEKSEAIRRKFMNSAAYNALIMEMITGDSATFLAEFIVGILPKSKLTVADAQAAAQQAIAEAKDTAKTP